MIIELDVIYSVLLFKEGDVYNLCKLLEFE